jgi:hypothetical protein
MSVRRTAGPILFVALATVASSACGARQARVESEPNPGARSGVGNNVLTDDLGRVRDAQAQYWRSHERYAGVMSELSVTPSSGVRLDLIQGDRNGWSAVASSGDFECSTYEGTVRSPRGYLNEAGIVRCR